MPTSPPSLSPYPPTSPTLKLTHADTLRERTLLPTFSTSRLILRPIQLTDFHLLDLLNNDPEVMTYLDHSPPSLQEIEEEVRHLVGRQQQPYEDHDEDENEHEHRHSATARRGRPRQDQRQPGIPIGRWIAEMKASGEFVGWFALESWDETKLEDTRVHGQDLPPAHISVSDVSGGDPSKGAAVLEVGYRLRRHFWDMGLATEGTKRVMGYAFTDDSLVAKIVAQTMSVNTRSRRVMEKCGMRCVGVFHVVFGNPLPGTEMGEVLYEIERREWMKQNKDDS